MDLSFRTTPRSIRVRTLSSNFLRTILFVLSNIWMECCVVLCLPNCLNEWSIGTKELKRKKKSSPFCVVFCDFAQNKI